MKKLRIAFLTTYFPSVSETFINDQLVGLLEKGHDVSLFAFKPDPYLSKKAIYDNRLKVFYYPLSKNLLYRALATIKLFFKALQKKDKPLLKSFFISPFALKLQLCHIFHFIRKFDFDIIHGQFGVNGNLGGYLKKLTISGKLVTTFRGYDVDLAIKKGGKVYDTAFLYSDQIHAISEYLYKKIIFLGAPPHKTVLHRTAVDLSKYTPALRKLKKESSLINIVTIARFVPKKNHLLALKSISRLKQMSPGISLNYSLIGYGKEEKKIKKAISKYQLEEVWFIFHGACSNAKTLEILKKSDIMLLTSSREGLGKSLLEAGRLGVPIVATKVGGIYETILGNQSGFLVNDCPKEIASKLYFLIHNPAIRCQIGSAASQFLEKNFDLNFWNTLLIQRYGELVNSYQASNRLKVAI